MTESAALLSDLCDLVSLQVDPATTPESPYLGLEHLEPGRLRAIGFGKASDAKSQKAAFEPGDVLYGKLRPYLDKAVLADRAGVATTELLVLRPKLGVSPEYLACVVHSPAFVEFAMQGVTGAQHPRTSWAHIRTFELPAHDRSEQASIAKLLWSLFDLSMATEQGIRSASSLKRAAMQQLFSRGLRGEAQRETEVGPVPESWGVAAIDEHFSVVSGGTPSRSNAAYWSGGTIPWVKTTEVNYSVITETEEHITQAGLNESAAKLLRPGTLLMAMYGQGVTRGKVGILGVEASCNQACAAMTPMDDEVAPRYLYHYLTSHYEAIRLLAHGGQQQNLNLDIVRKIGIAVPPTIDEQQEIVDILDALDLKTDLHRRKRAVLDQLFKSLLHKLMTGEISVYDLDLSALPASDGSAA
ncbi:restriction endonuclease subunit S [Mycobacterium hubeiense]|uniref:restriction endonuclease subunit S n=1 Tax=Mycobacterium hubeiense TaxID=1867256 RepID=UPI000C7EBF89|nr:restriction endonuclease subunit S [Mycobacterium sp. QGD 101]